jgi:hypothetical protein
MKKIEKKMPKDWELTLGLYPGIVLGFRTYNYDDGSEHVLYLPFVNISLNFF